VKILLASRIVATAAALASLTCTASGQASAASPHVRTSVDRTAVWVGDRIRFTIEIECPRGVDVLDDDLSQDKLKLEGLDVVSSGSDRIDGPGDTATRRFVYQLTTYRVDLPALRIAPLSVRYYVRHPGQRLEDTAPAGEVQIPGTSIAFRSTLQEAQEYTVRDARSATPRPRLYTLAQPAGLALVIVSFAPAVVWAVGAISRRRHRPVHRSVRKVRSDERASLEAARGLDLTTEDARREVYTTIDGLVRAHLQEVCGVPGASLTPAEAELALAERGVRIDAQRVAALLAECERARYAPRHAVPSSDACRDAVMEAEQLLGVAHGS
jgi:hypothetical protein